jgi:4-hydroxybenzoate polyprenyltransferase
MALQRWRRSSAEEGEVSVEDGVTPEEAVDLGEDLEDDLDDDVLLDDSGREAYVAERDGLLARHGGVPLQLLRAAHAKQAILTALCLAGAAALAGRRAEEVAVVGVTVLVGQTILGWHNDIVDKPRDEANATAGKPLAEGRLATGTVWYAIVVAAFVLVPLSITSGITAGLFYLGSVCAGMLGNVVLRTGFLSWWSWAVSFALFPAYLSYGGWGGKFVGEPPETSLVVLAALLGIGVHFMRAVWGLVADHAEGWTYLPLKLGLKLGATRLLGLSTLYTAAVVVLVLVFAARDGLNR